MSEPVRNMPLFPLHSVLYPGVILPLRIFEPRYRQMIAECLEGDRTFGVCLIRRGEEVGEPAEPYEVGTTAEIVRVEPQEDGRMHLLAVGRERFRIREIVQQRPCIAAEVEILPEPAVSEAAQERLPGFRQHLERYIRLLAELLGQEAAEVSLPNEPDRVVYLAASLLQVSNEEKQSLLELASTEDRLHRVEEQLARLIEKAEVLADRRRRGVATPFDAREALRRYPPN